MAIDSRKVLLAALGMGLLPASAQVMAQEAAPADPAAELAPASDPAAMPTEAMPVEAAPAEAAPADAAAPAPEAAAADPAAAAEPAALAAPAEAAPAAEPAPAAAEAAPAAEPAPASETAESEDGPLKQGSYIAPLGSFVKSDHLGEGFGGELRAGYRQGWYAVEAGGLYTDGLDGSATFKGGSINGLIFPLKSLPLYALIGAGALETDKDPGHPNGSYSTTTVQGGLGYLLGLNWGERYEYAIRAEALYRYGHRERRLNAQQEDLPVPRDFDDYIVNLGLHLPLSRKAPPPPPPEPPKVVEPVTPPDSDGDGVPDDLDQCPGTAPGVKVDEKGCPVSTCDKAPGEGGVQLEGCLTGDVIVLRGVNFEFDQSRLTVNAKTILDQVATELNEHPDVVVELSGHTDSLGSDEYNQALSDRRAASVKKYLTRKGIGDERMVAVGMGEAAPVDTNETEEGRELNRRVELKILSGSPSVGAAPAADAAAPAADAAAAPVEAAPAADATALTAEPAPAPEAAPVDAAPAADPAVEALPTP